ncbi:hypothetical protein N9L68_02510 [bacterium]|nr:hypothetical protein [bacterium]
MSTDSAGGLDLHLRLGWQLLQHRGEQVRGHIERLVEYEGQSILMGNQARGLGEYRRGRRIRGGCGSADRPGSSQGALQVRPVAPTRGTRNDAESRTYIEQGRHDALVTDGKNHALHL